MEGQLEFGISIYGLYMKENGSPYEHALFVSFQELKLSELT
jgi:hypothetical protein